MATITQGVSLAVTTNGSSYTTGSFTPAANDLLVVAVHPSGTLAPSGAVSDTQGLGWTKITGALSRSSGDNSTFWVANTLAAATSLTVTFACPSDSATGCAIEVLRISGVTRTGSAAVRQSNVVENQAAGTPAVSFAGSVLTGNPTIGFVSNATNPATLTPPTSWTEAVDVGYATPTTGLEVVYRNSGFTGTTITWGNSSASAYSATIVEIDTSAPNFPPTVALNTADASSLGSTPALDFTGTDSNGDDIRYNIQVDTTNTFNGMTGTIASAGTHATSNTTSLSVTTTTVGNLLVFTYSGNNTSSPVVASVSGGNVASWTLATSNFFSGTGSRLEIWYGIVNATGAATISFTVTGFSNFTNANAHEFSKTAGIWALSDVNSLTGTSSSSFNYPSITPTNPGLYIGVTSANNSTTLSSGSTTGYTYINNAGAATDQITYNPSVSTTTQPNSVSSVSGQYNSVAVVFTTAAPLLDKVSGTDAGFSGTPDNTDPFASGQQVTFIPQNPTLADSYSESNQSTTDAIGPGNILAGQIFTPSVTGVISGAKFNLAKSGTVSGNVTVKVYATTGTPGSTAVGTGTALATSDAILATSIATNDPTYTLTSFTFSGSNQITLSAGTYYAIVVAYSSALFDAVRIGVDNTSPTHGGNYVTYDGATWAANSSIDACFYVTVGVPVLSSGTYYWRVRGIDPSGSNTYGSWATTRSFTVSSGSVLTKTQTTIARIATNLTKTQPSVARIANTKTKTQPSISRISQTFTKTQTTVSRVANKLTKNQPVTARIQNTGVAKNQSTIARIANNRALTQSSVSRIAQNFTKTQTAVSRISNTRTVTQPSVSRIARNLTKTQGVVASIQKIGVTKTQPVISRISNTRTVTQPTISRIAQNLTKTQGVLANIVQSGAGSKTQPSIARIATNRSVTQPSVSRIANNFTKTQGTLSRIANTKTKTQPTVSRIATTKTVTQPVNSRIANTKTKTQPTISRISQSFPRTQGTVSRVAQNLTKTQPLTANIIQSGVSSKTQTTVSRIANTRSLTQGSVSRIAVNGSKTQPVSSRIANNRTKTQGSVSRISQTYTKTQGLSARIATRISKTQGIRAYITNSNTPSAPKIVLLTDGRVAYRINANLYLPL